MKAIAVFAVCLGSLYAQVTLPPPGQPQLSGLPNLPDTAVIAVFDDGASMTMGQFRALLTALPPQNQQVAASHPKDFIEGWALMRKLAHLAETAKLDQQSPVREQILYSRLLALNSAQVNAAMNAIVIGKEAIAEYYNTNKETFKQVKTGAIYIAFSTSPGPAGGEGKKPLSQDEAKAKAVKLLAQVRAGADFSKLARENSDDETSRAKGGFFADLGPADSVPEAIRNAVFALKAGETTEPVSQPNGYYLFRAESVSYRGLADVQDQIYNQLKQERFQEWFTNLRNDTTVQYMNPSFPGGTPPPGSGK